MRRGTNVTGWNRWISAARAGSLKLGVAALGATAVGAAVTVPRTAEACGGFFCSSVPIDQSGERILFAVDDTTVKAHIQIFYSGDAEKFSWVLPIPGEPTAIGVGTDTLFQNLDWQTGPQFNLNWQYDQNCQANQWRWASEGDFSGAPTAGGDPKDDGVDVLQQGDVGPYNFAVVKAESSGADGAAAMYSWLDENGYDQPEYAKDLVAQYVAEDHVFVAVKLQSDKAVGDIQPLTLEYPFPGSCVPLRLTSIAATDDMPIWVWVLGKDRAVPVNYFHVEVNEAQIDWLNYGSNYRDIAAKAVDTAAGRAFLTEYAGDTLGFQNQLYKPGQWDLEALETKTKPWEWVQAALSMGIPRSAMMQELLRTYIPKPDSLKDVTEQDFYNNLQGYESQLAGQAFDVEGLTAELSTKIVEPIKAAEQLFHDYQYVTRLFTVMSPNEMSRDPIFLFNPDLPNVSNQRQAYAKPICDPTSTTPNQATQVEVTLQDGTVLTYDLGDPNQFEPPVLVGGSDDATPGAVQRMYTSGEPEAVEKGSIATVDSSFDSITIGLLTANNGQPTVDRPTSGKTSGTGATAAGCTASRTGAFAGIGGIVALALAGLGLLRRRRAN
ncbi:MAG: DUF2330 domain-containing protein [Myxococcales bacterium]|nr:DUF2330 domain-containing protein [Myxococcales bacterium]